jgi:hypothetical protein
MRIDASGNLGLGVTPSAWNSVVTALQVKDTTIYSTTNATSLSTNNFVNSGGLNKYINTGFSTLYYQASGSHQFYTAPSGTAGNTITFTQAMTLDASGGLQTLNTIGVGNATPSTSGAGITFPATQSASSNANTLDDYEEGTWTPVMSGSTTAGTGTYTGQAGAYRKIGSVVYYSLDMGWTAHTGTGDMILSGLPFTSNGTYCAGAVRASTGLALSASHYPQVFVNVNATTFSWEQFPVGGGFQSGIAMDTSAAIMIAGFYFV